MSSAKAKFILTLYRQDVNLVNKAEAFGNRLYSYKKQWHENESFMPPLILSPFSGRPATSS